MARQFLDIPEAQDLALQALYIATNGASWTDNTGWGGATAADAFGVTVAGGVVTGIDLHGNNLDGTIDISLFDDLPNCILFLAYVNTSFIMTGSIADNSTLIYLRIHSTSSVITGSIADNSTLTELHVFGTPSVITGSIADNSTLIYLRLPSTSSVITGSIADNSTLAYLHVGSTSSVITGGDGTLGAYLYEEIKLDDNAYTTAQIDEIINAIYRLRANFTYATPSLNIGGTNAAPTGIYQEGTQSTPAEKLYALVNDPNTEGFNTWTVTYSNKPVCGTGFASKILSTQAQLNMPVSVPDGGSLTVTFKKVSDDSTIDTDTVVGEGIATCDWAGLSAYTAYAWYAVADDGDTTTQSANVSFTTNPAISNFNLNLGLYL